MNTAVKHKYSKEVTRAKELIKIISEASPNHEPQETQELQELNELKNFLYNAYKHEQRNINLITTKQEYKQYKQLESDFIEIFNDIISMYNPDFTNSAKLL